MTARRIVIFEGEVPGAPAPDHFARCIDTVATAFGLSAEIVEAPLSPEQTQDLASLLPPGYLRRTDIEELALDRGNPNGIATRLFHAAVARGRDLDRHPSSEGRHVIMAQGDMPEGVFVHRAVFDSLLHGPHQTNFGSKTRELAQALLDQPLPQPEMQAAVMEQAPPQAPQGTSSLSLTFEMPYFPVQS
jgi:hypothetical protein